MLLFEGEASEAGYNTGSSEKFGFEKFGKSFSDALSDALDVGRFQSFFIELEKVLINSCLVNSEMNRNKEDFLEPCLK
jgi:hypothetical protein